MSDDTAVSPIRVVIAEDSALFREGLVRILEASGFVVVEQAGDLDSLLAAAKTHEPDAVITDIRMPPSGTTEGLDAAIQIRAERPGTPVMVLSQYVETRHVARLLEDGTGGIGYLLKDRVADGRDFIDSMTRIVGGGSVIDPEVVERLIHRGGSAGELAALTEREREILSAMAEGRSNNAIGKELFLSPKTVESHVGTIMFKLGLAPTADDNRRVLAVLAFLRST